MTLSRLALTACVTLACLAPTLASAGAMTSGALVDDALKQIFHGRPMLAEQATITAATKLKGPTWSYDFMTNCIRKFVGPVGFVGSPVCLTWGGYKN